MRRALLGLSLLFLAATTAVAQVGTLDGYVNVSLSGDEATVTSAADVTYTVNTFFNCHAYYQVTQCVFTLSGTHAIQPGFQTPFWNVDGYHATIQGPTTTQTCYTASLDAAVWLQTDVFPPLPVTSNSWLTDREVCTFGPPRTTFHLAVFANYDGAAYLTDYMDGLAPGTIVTVEAWAGESPYVFVGWSGDTASSSTTAVFSIWSNMIITANYIYVPQRPPGEPPPCDNCSPDNQNPPNSPIVLNFGRGNYKLAGADSPVTFDIAASGVPTRIGWTAAGADEAFLCLDRNGNGIIDDGSELFGTATRLRSGARAPNGFVALAGYDENHDGLLDARDAIWSELLLWHDLNHDGVSQPAELAPVAGSDVAAISLTYHWTGRRDASGNTFRYETLAWMGGGGKATPRPVYDIFFVSVP